MTAQSRLVLITAPLTGQGLERLQGISSELDVRHWRYPTMGALPAALWREVEILYTSFASPLPSPADAPRLRWVQLYSAGPDHILSHPLFASPVIFTTTSGIHAIPIAEYVFTMVLAWFHRLPRMIEWQQRRAWPDRSERFSLFAGEELRGKTLGIVGYGSIGRELARLAAAFGMRILAMQRGSTRRDPGFALPGVGDQAGALPERYYAPDELHSMLGECDVVVLAVPLTAQTRGMFDEAAFRALKPSAFLVNIARGDICDEGALLRALREQTLGGAALDVFQQEPLPADHPLWSLPNVFISPHASGLTQLYEERAATVFEENLHRYIAGESLYNLVDKVQEY
ncbi:MAG TPA: D-2-hydroxyacid dehydrogenase [Ktedonobacteraceae bacterium]|nr:D-2-hydroxyacid dehydrogenase [Ktedonobacteraceae bacterium]